MTTTSPTMASSGESLSESSYSSSSSSTSRHSVHRLELDPGSDQDEHDINNDHGIASLATATTFRDDVRSEWIMAVLGSSGGNSSSSCRLCQDDDTMLPQQPLQQPHSPRPRPPPSPLPPLYQGRGLAALGEYTAYSVTIPSSSSSTSRGTTTAVTTTTTTAVTTTTTTTTTTSPPSSCDDSLGLSLSRLALGLYVRHVLPGSEAWCAGIVPQSILISINGMALLAEPSKQALERLWQYEGYLAGESSLTDGDAPSTTNTTTSTNSSTTTATATNTATTTTTTTTASGTANSGTPATTTTGDAVTSGSRNRIRDPLHMTLMQEGRLYSVLLLSNPPYGIDWAPCGNFCLVKKCKGKALKAGIIPGSIVTSIHVVTENNNHHHNNNNHSNTAVHLQDLDHTLAASTLRKFHTSGHDIQISLCVLPRKARSGFYEHGSVHEPSRNNYNAITTTTKNKNKTEEQHTKSALACKRTDKIERRKVAATLDGIEIRVHPLLQSAAAASPRSSTLPPLTSSSTTTTTTKSTSTTMKSLSQLAFRVAAGEFFSFSKPQYQRGKRRFYSQRNFKNCPPLDQPLPNLLSMDQALSYLLHYHFADYNELKLASPAQRQPRGGGSSDLELSQVWEFFRLFGSSSVSSFSRKRKSISNFLLPILAFIRMQGWQDSELARMVVDIASGGGSTTSTSSSSNSTAAGGSRPTDVPNIHLAHCMEFMARALDLTTIREQLAEMREKRAIQPRQRKQIPIRVEQAPDSPIAADASVVTGTTVLSTAILSDAPHHHHIEDDDSKPVAKSRKGILGLFRKKKTNKFKSQSSAQLTSAINHHKAMDSKAMTQVANSPRRPLFSTASTTKPRVNLDLLFANTLQFLEELEAVCADIEKSLLRSFSQKIAAWALQPWSASKETELAQVTQVMRERLRVFPTLPILNPIDSSTLLSVDTEGSYILPSAHFPLLLTFDCQVNASSANDISPFGEDEAIYRTKVELLDLVGLTVRRDEATCRTFVVHGSVGGAIVQSGSSVTTNGAVDRHTWDDGNVLAFENRSSWGPPQTLGLFLSHSADKIITTDENGRLKYDREVGQCLVDLSLLWKEAIGGDGALSTGSQTLQLKVLKYREIDDFDQHGDLVTRGPKEILEDIEIRIKIAVQKIPLTEVGGNLPKKRSLLYKHDDDLRQELFAIDFVKSCDQILRSCGLDLKLLTFRCIPVGQQRGFIEWIHGSVPLSEICQPFAGSILGGNKADPSRSDSGRSWDTKATDDPLSSVAKAGLTKYESPRCVKNNTSSTNPIQDFLRAFHYAPDDPYMVRKSVMETYLKSCAGYCAITYILGVGDRHLDNLLLHPTGHFFHCDFSFILGHDPKKYLPLRITEDMVNGMGGRDSDNYAMFLSLTCAAFLTFRRPENVRHVMSFVRLMDGSCTFASSSDSKQPLETALLGIRERLRLDLSDDDAISFMERLVEESCSSKMWIAVDAIHSIGKRF